MAPFSPQSRVTEFSLMYWFTDRSFSQYSWNFGHSLQFRPPTPKRLTVVFFHILHISSYKLALEKDVWKKAWGFADLVFLYAVRLDMADQFFIRNWADFCSPVSSMISGPVLWQSYYLGKHVSSDFSHPHPQMIQKMSLVSLLHHLFSQVNFKMSCWLREIALQLQ